MLSPLSRQPAMIERFQSSRGLAVHHLLYGLIAIALVVVVVIQLGKGDSRPETAAGPAEQPAAPADPTLMDPSPYRPVIEQIETILYKDGAAELADGDRVSRLALQLGTQLLRAPNRLQGQRAGHAVMAFSNNVGQQSDVGYTTLDVAWARREWEAVRDKVFSRAAWLR